MAKMKWMLVVAVLVVGFTGVLAANGDTMQTPLPDYDGLTPTILEGESDDPGGMGRDSDSGGWGNTADDPRVACKQVANYHELVGHWVQWEDKNVGGAGDYDIWLSWGTGYSGTGWVFELLAGPDAGDLTSRGTMTVTASGYTPKWDNFGTLSLAAGDDTFRILLGNQSWSKDTRIDALLFSKIPEPATLCLLGIGGIGMLIRRRRS